MKQLGVLANPPNMRVRNHRSHPSSESMPSSCCPDADGPVRFRIGGKRILTLEFVG